MPAFPCEDPSPKLQRWFCWADGRSCFQTHSSPGYLRAGGWGTATSSAVPKSIFWNWRTLDNHHYLGCCLVAKSCLTLCDPRVCSLPGSSVHRILQARILGWVAISSSRGSSWPRDWTHISCIGKWVIYHWASKEVHCIPSTQLKSWLQSWWEGQEKKTEEQP